MNTTDTDCRKCGAEMPPVHHHAAGFLRAADFVTTAYRCSKCGHWNNLKSRKKRIATEAQDSPNDEALRRGEVK